MGKTVVITGASTGIGEACALHLDSKGWRVIAGVRKQADGERLKAKGSSRLMPVIIDVADDASVIAAAKTVAGELGDGGLGGLVNNAGIAVAGPLEFVSLDELRTQLDVNVVGVVATTQAFLPLLRRAVGRIVIMGSVGGRISVPFAGPYSASKFAVEALTDAMRIELSPWGIHVSLIEAAAVATPIWQKGIDATAETRERMPAAAEELYGRAMDLVTKVAEHEARIGIDPVEIAERVEHALTAPKPRTRYILGKQARTRVFLGRYAPDRLRDRLVSAQLRLSKR